jgi:hypothetical protein
VKLAKGTHVTTPGPSRDEGGDVGWAEWTVVGPEDQLRNGRRLYRLAPANDAARYLLDVLRSGDVQVRGRLNADGEFVQTARYLHVIDPQSGGRQ